MSAIAQAASLLRLPARRRGGLRRWRGKAIVAIVSVLAIAAAYTFWFRDSGFVTVSEVRIQGVSRDTPEAAGLKRALERAAGEMTTLHVRTELLDRAVRPFPLVRSVSAEPRFPSGLLIRVVERRPAALIGSGSAAVVVAADGLIIRSLPTEGLELPRLPLAAAPERLRLRGPVLDQARVLGGAPVRLQPYLESSRSGEEGVEVILRGGVELRFGTPGKAAEKWRAAAAVLSDPGLGALDYVDLSAPARPAVGGAGQILAPPP